MRTAGRVSSFNPCDAGQECHAFATGAGAVYVYGRSTAEMGLESETMVSYANEKKGD
jgi:hypothetical protein